MVCVLIRQNIQKYASVIQLLKEASTAKLLGHQVQLKLKEHSTIPPPHFKKASVLIPLIINNDGELEVLLTVRKPEISLFDYEVSLPGGKVDESDKSIIDTALRESYEEIGLPPENVEIIDTLNPLLLSFKRKYSVYPVIGLVRDTFYAKLNPSEVLDVFTVPLIKFLEQPHLKEDGRGKTISMRNMRGMVTNLNFEVMGLTYIILTMYAIVVYDKMPHETAVKVMKNFVAKSKL